MKKFNKVLAILCASVVAGSMGALAGCKTDGGNGDGAHTHNYKYTTVDNTNHKGVCQNDGCDKKEVTEPHTWGSNNKCSKCDVEKPAAVTVTAVKISGNTTAKVGEEVQLTATVEGTGNPAQTVTWSKVSGEGSVSSDGKVTATAAGDVKVKATSTVDTAKSKEYTVTFEAAEVTLTLSESYVGLDDSGDLTSGEVTVTYDGEGTLEATSKNTAVATVAYADDKITITAVGTGKAVIEVTDGEKKAELTAEVATAGLTYETLSGETEDGETYEYIQVSDGAGRTSTDLYIPGYRYSEEANEGDGGLLPVTHIKSSTTSDGVSFSDDAGGFSKTNITTIYTGDNVSVIGGHAFFKCDSLTKVVVGPALRHIMAFSFEQNDSNVLTELDLSESVNLNKIDRCAFRYISVQEFTIPVNCEGLGDSVFMGCTAMKKMKILSTKLNKLWGSTFLNAGITELWLSKSVTDIAKDAFGSFSAGGDITIKVCYNGTQEEYDAIHYSNGQWDFGKALKPNENSGCTLVLNCNFAEMLEAEKAE